MNITCPHCDETYLHGNAHVCDKPIDTDQKLSQVIEWLISRTGTLETHHCLSIKGERYYDIRLSDIQAVAEKHIRKLIDEEIEKDKGRLVFTGDITTNTWPVTEAQDEINEEKR